MVSKPSNSLEQLAGALKAVVNGPRLVHVTFTVIGVSDLSGRNDITCVAVALVRGAVDMTGILSKEVREAVCLNYRTTGAFCSETCEQKHQSDGTTAASL